jgi:hypothetical protein
MRIVIELNLPLNYHFDNQQVEMALPPRRISRDAMEQELLTACQGEI